MAAAMATTPLRLSTWHTQPMRRMLVSRSSFEKPRPLLRCVRMTSPSRTSTFMPRAHNSSSSRFASVDLPAPDNPVNQMVRPLCSMIRFSIGDFVVILDFRLGWILDSLQAFLRRSPSMSTWLTSGRVNSNGRGWPCSSIWRTCVPLKLSQSSLPCGHVLALTIPPHLRQ